MKKLNLLLGIALIGVSSFIGLDALTPSENAQRPLQLKTRGLASEPIITNDANEAPMLSEQNDSFNLVNILQSINTFNLEEELTTFQNELDKQAVYEIDSFVYLNTYKLESEMSTILFEMEKQDDYEFDSVEIKLVAKARTLDVLEEITDN